MIVFCPNCGTQNPGLPGARATCTACSSTFDVPAEAGRRAAAPPEPAPPPVREAPPPPSFSAPAAGPSPTRTSRKTNTLAIVSLVSGIVCCIPFVSPMLAIVCGIRGLKQLDLNHDTEAGRPLAIAGIVLGAVAGLLQLFGFIGAIR